MRRNAASDEHDLVIDEHRRNQPLILLAAVSARVRRSFPSIAKNRAVRSGVLF